MKSDSETDWSTAPLNLARMFLLAAAANGRRGLLSA